MLKLFVLIAFLSEICRLKAELWEKDVSSAMEIGLSTTGYKSVDLRCEAEHFAVNVTLENDFKGVVYSRGSFDDKDPLCFKRHHQNLSENRDKLIIGMRIPFNDCRSIMHVSESFFSNVIIVQHDPELIMPGDAAFSLQCYFKPELWFITKMSYPKPTFKSKITLISADPAEKENLNADEKMTAVSNTDKVTFIPGSKSSKDEL